MTFEKRSTENWCIKLKNQMQTNIYFVLNNGKFGIFFNFFNETFNDS